MLKELYIDKSNFKALSEKEQYLLDIINEITTEITFYPDYKAIDLEMIKNEEVQWSTYCLKQNCIHPNGNKFLKCIENIIEIK